MMDFAIKKIYYSISEVSKMTDVKPYILRYWESEFPELNPSKNRAGKRTYRSQDIEIIHHIKKLLYDEKYTIEGARARIKELHKTDNPLQSELEPPVGAKEEAILREIQQRLREILEIINRQSN